LLPGLDGTGLLFRPLLAALPADLNPKVVTYPVEPLGLPELAAFVSRQLPAKKAVLLAESFSGLVALTMLMSGAARIRAVIFVGGFAEPPRPLLLRLAPLVSRSAGMMRSAPAFLLRQYCLGKDAGSTDLKMLRDTLAATSPDSVAQRLRLIATRHSFGKAVFDVPACYIRASQDRLVPGSCANWFQQRFAKCDVVDVDGPHFVLQMKARSCAEIIVRAVRSVD
jgi:pimeloyl-[acyl-carrier protein] methyl ester esterase